MESLDSQEAGYAVRAIEAATAVKREAQFFVWLQSYFGSLVPHELAVCGAYQRDRRDLDLKAYNSIAIPDAALRTLTDTASPLLRQVLGAWRAGANGHAARIDLAAAAAARGAGAGTDALAELGLKQLVVHGISRPQRPDEVESLFMLLGRGSGVTDRQLACFEMLLPHLHVTFLRVRAIEREMHGTVTAQPSAKRDAAGAIITRRERQILQCVREGKSNQEIGESLAISVLTVKNHIQKILRKLGASNRTHAVSRATALGLWAPEADSDAVGHEPFDSFPNMQFD